MMARKETLVAEEVAPRGGAAAVESPEFSFPVDIYDQEDEVVLVADLPGVAGNAVDVHLDRGELTIRGRVDQPVPKGESVLEEYRVGDFVRTFTVSEDIDPTGIAAELKNGVLTLRLPKAAERKPRKIAVKAG
jgi:HSP20 family molecular chaperone IbpA